MELSKKNHGTTVEKVAGMRIKTAYGKDDSDVTGSAKEERGGELAGGIENLGHSLKGTSANQKGK